MPYTVKSDQPGLSSKIQMIKTKTFRLPYESGRP
jgi:hypothetical protein